MKLAVQLIFSGFCLILLGMLGIPLFILLVASVIAFAKILAVTAIIVFVVIMAVRKS
jgi:hypothetical protein